MEQKTIMFLLMSQSIGIKLDLTKLLYQLMGIRNAF